MFASVFAHDATYGIARGTAGRAIPKSTPRTCGCAKRCKQLKERLKVLERITVEKENSLAKEIE